MKLTPYIGAVLLTIFVAACKDEPKTEEPKPKRPIIVEGFDSLANSVNAYAPVDISPMDMSYFPVDYPKIKMANGGAPIPVARVVYSRPHLAKRRLFSDILKYEEPWRLGANESTEITFYKTVTIDNKKVQPGRYIIYTIPHPDSWTIVLNSNIDTWGLKQDPAKDIDRFTIPITTGNPVLEFFTIVFEKTETGCDLVIGWDDVLARVPIKF